jgi:hypothetical protein
MNQCKCGLCETVPHDSDCAVHNEPATPNGDCDCRGESLRDKEVILFALDFYAYARGGTAGAEEAKALAAKIRSTTLPTKD